MKTTQKRIFSLPILLLLGILVGKLLNNMALGIALGTFFWILALGYSKQKEKKNNP